MFHANYTHTAIGLFPKCKFTRSPARVQSVVSIIDYYWCAQRKNKITVIIAHEYQINGKYKTNIISPFVKSHIHSHLENANQKIKNQEPALCDSIRLLFFFLCSRKFAFKVVEEEQTESERKREKNLSREKEFN